VIDRLRDPRMRVVLAVMLLGVCVVGWPASMLTVARGEPPFVLSLSWLALILTALDILATTDTRRQVEE
jgi:hypothetical protein